MQTKQPTKCFEPFKKLRARLASKHRFKTPSYYLLTFTSEVVDLLLFLTLPAFDASFGDVSTSVCTYAPPPPGILGIWGEGLFIFRELGSTANYFRGAGEPAHTFGDLGSTAKM